RQGLDGGRRGPQDRLPQHPHPAYHQRRHRHDHQPLRRPGADAGSRRHGQGPARPAAEDLPAGATGPPGDDSLLSAQRRHARQDRPPPAQPHQEARRGALQDPVRVRRRGGEAGGVALHGERVGWADDRRDFDQYDAAGDQPGVPATDDVGRRHPPRPGRRRERELRLRVRRIGAGYAMKNAATRLNSAIATITAYGAANPASTANATWVAAQLTAWLVNGANAAQHAAVSALMSQN